MILKCSINILLILIVILNLLNTTLSRNNNEWYLKEYECDENALDKRYKNKDTQLLDQYMILHVHKGNLN